MVRQPSNLRLTLVPERIESYCRRWGIVRLELFGSVLTEGFGPQSDVDFLYTLNTSTRWGLDFVDACDELSIIIGRSVDLLSRRAVERSSNALRRKAILETAQLLYVA